MRKQQPKIKLHEPHLPPLALTLVIGLLCASVSQARIEENMPHGVMLNLDLERVADGLIPSKSLFPLYVPMDGLGLEYYRNRHSLAFLPGEGLDIPHSSLLDPRGDEWIISVRAYCLTDGLILSQANDTHGVVIYMKDGHIIAKVKTGNNLFFLKEDEHRGMSKHTRRWVTAEVRIRKGMSILYLNRKRVAMMMDEPGLDAENLRIRIGNHKKMPAPLKNATDMTPTGFTGAINSFKILRQ